MCMYMYAYMCAITINEKKEVMNLKESRKGEVGGGSGRRERKGEILQLNYNLKSKCK